MLSNMFIEVFKMFLSYIKSLTSIKKIYNEITLYFFFKSFGGIIAIILYLITKNPFNINITTWSLLVQ
jgi:hypothetical protein